MCLRNAQHKNEGALAFKFWSSPPWDWTFKRQLYAANALLKKFPESAVVRAINSDELKSVFSLNNVRVLPVVKKYNLIIKEELSKSQKLDIVDSSKPRKKTYGKKSILNRLRDIDGKEEQDTV